VSKAKRKMTNQELIDYVAKKFRLEPAWAYWLVRAIDEVAARDGIDLEQFSKSKKLRYFIDGFCAAAAMHDVVTRGCNEKN
jgi:hypothetical protein